MLFAGDDFAHFRAQFSRLDRAAFLDAQAHQVVMHIQTGVGDRGYHLTMAVDPTEASPALMRDLEQQVFGASPLGPVLGEDWLDQLHHNIAFTLHCLLVADQHRDPRLLQPGLRRALVTALAALIKRHRPKLVFYGFITEWHGELLHLARYRCTSFDQ